MPVQVDPPRALFRGSPLRMPFSTPRLDDQPRVDGTAVGTSAQGVGGAPDGGSSAAALAIGSIPGQGTGQSRGGSSTGAATAVGVASQGAGKSASGAASGAALALGSAPGVGTGQVPSGTAVAGTSGLAVGTTAQGTGSARSGSAVGVVLVDRFARINPEGVVIIRGGLTNRRTTGRIRWP